MQNPSLFKKEGKGKTAACTEYEDRISILTCDENGKFSILGRGKKKEESKKKVPEQKVSTEYTVNN